MRALDCMQFEDRTLFNATPLAAEVLVNTDTTGTQQVQAQPAVAADASGNYVVAWKGNDADGTGIFAQLYDASGNPIGGQFQANTNAVGSQYDPVVARAANGNFAIFWTSDVSGNAGIYGQLFDAAGNPIGGEIHANTTTADMQQQPSVAMDDNGNFIVVWQSQAQDGDGWGVYAQRFDATGAAVGGEFMINTTTTGDQWNPSVAMDGTGNFIVAWQSSGQDGDGQGIFAQRYNSAGVKVGAEFQVNTTTTADQVAPSVAVNGSGDFVVAWASNLQDGSGYGIYAQRFNSGGAAQGSEFRVNVTTASAQSAPHVAISSNGSFVVSWTSTDQDVAGTSGVYFRQYDASGVAQSNETLINSTIAGNQQNASLAMQSVDSFVVVWSGNGVGDSSGVFAQLYVDGANQAPVNSMPGAQSTAEDTNLVFSAGNGNQISVADADAHSNPVQVTLTATNGTLTLATLAGLTFSAGDGTDDLTMTLTGTAADINAALDGLTFTPGTNFVGAASVAITTNDLGYSGNGGAQSDSDSVAITVTAVNDPPVITAPDAVSTNINTGFTFSNANNDAIILSDVDAGGATVQVTLTSSNGTFTLAGTTGLSFTSGDGTGDALMTFTGTLANINIALDGSIFMPSNNFGGMAGLQIDVNDLGNSGAGGAQTATFTVPIDVHIGTRVNTTTAGNQHEPAMAMDALGNYVVVWTSDNQDGGGKGVYGQRFDSAGNLVGGEFRVNTTTANDQNAPAVAMDANGNFVVAWTSANQDGDGKGIYAQRYNSAGVAQGSEFLVNVTTAGNQDQAAVAMDANGNFAIAWKGDRGGVGTDVYERKYDASGVALTGEVRANTNTTDNQDQPAIAMDSSGNYVVVWKSNKQDTSGAGVFGQRFNASGVAQGSEFQINTTDSGDQNRPFVAMTSDGRFVVSWSSGNNQDGNGRGIFFQRYDASGVKQGGETQANAYTASDQDWSGVAIDSSGNFSIAWMSNNQDGSKHGIYAQKFAADGSTIGSEFRVNATTQNEQKNPVIAAGYFGDFAIAWEGNGVGDTQGVFTKDFQHVNQAPVITVPAGQTTNENTQLVLSTGNGNVISISDADAYTGSLLVSLSVSGGTGVLSLSTISGLSFLSGDGTSDSSMQFTGTVANINAALDGLIYTPAAGYNGTAAIGISVSDQGNHGTGGAKSDAEGVSVTVTAVNDAPVNTVPGPQSTNEDTPLVFSSGNGNQVSVADVDAGSSSIQVTLAGTNGALTLSGTTGLSFLTGTGAGDATMTFTGTIADINTALNGLSFTPTSNFNGAAQLQIVTNDLGNTGSGGALSDTDTVAITVNAVNDAPVNTVPGPQSTNEDTPLVFSGGNGNQISVADVDAAGNPLQVTLAVTNGLLTLSGTIGLSFLTGTGAGDATMTFTGMIADINTALNGLSFTPTANYNGAAQLQIVTDDQGNSGAGGALSDTDTVAITVNAVNDAPVNAVPGPQSTNEDTPLVFSNGNGNQVSVADVDAGANPVQVTLSATNGAITLSGTTGLSFTTGTGTGDATMTFTGTIADINTALNGLSFTPTANFNGAAQLQIVTNDLGNTGSGGALSDTDTVAITVNAVNDAPVNTVPGPQSTNEDTPLVFSNGNGNQISVADVDAAGNPLQVTLTVTNGLLTLNGTTGLSFLTGTGAGDATMTFTGTIADINTALNGLSFTPTSNFNGAAQLQIVTNDQGNSGAGGALSDTDTVAITVNAVNDAPTLNAPGSEMTAFRQPVVFSTAQGTQVSLADIDSASGSLQLTIVAQHGTVTLAQTSGLSFVSGSGTADTTVVVQGNASDLNAALDGLVFNPDSTFRGSATVNFTVNDLGNTGGGGPQQAAAQTTIDVQPASQRLLLNGPTSQPADNFQVTFSSATGNGLQFVDVYNENPILSVSLSTTNGTFTLSNTNGLTFTSGNGSGSSMTFSGTLSNINAALQGSHFVADTSDSTLSIQAADPPRDGTGPQTVSSSIVISQPAVFPVVTPIMPVTQPAEETNAETLQPIIAIAPVPTVAPAEFALPPPRPFSAPYVEQTTTKGIEWKLAERVIVRLETAEESLSQAGNYGDFGGKEVKRLLGKESAGTHKSASLDVLLPWTRISITTKPSSTENFSQALIAGTAGVTATLSVGYLLWSLRAASLLSTFLASMPAWQAFDPLPVIDFENRRRNHGDEDDEDEDLDASQALFKSTENLG